MKRNIPPFLFACAFTVAFTPKGGCPLKPLFVGRAERVIPPVAFTPKGGCPLKRRASDAHEHFRLRAVAFTPKGGCPLKLCQLARFNQPICSRSIHPQGWVPIETSRRWCRSRGSSACSIHPQGWVPIETQETGRYTCPVIDHVAFTPKGGCPLKLDMLLTRC